MTDRKRPYSRDPEHLREDLAASLSAALGPNASKGSRETAEAITAQVKTFDDSQRGLRDVLEAFGPRIYGAMLLFHLEAKTSLSNQAGCATASRDLASVGLSFRDLEWPSDALHPNYLDAAAPSDPAREAAMTAAVAAWRAAHPEPTGGQTPATEPDARISQILAQLEDSPCPDDCPSTSCQGDRDVRWLIDQIAQRDATVAALHGLVLAHASVAEVNARLETILTTQDRANIERRAPGGRVLDQEEKIAIRKGWDAAVVASQGPAEAGRG